MTVGRVTQMTFDAEAEPRRRIAVTLSLEEELVNRDVVETYADVEDLVRDVGYRPETPIRKGIQE